MKFWWRCLLLAAALMVVAGSVVVAQSTPGAGAAAPAPMANGAAGPSFDVATIKPHTGPFHGRGLRYEPDGFSGTVTLTSLVQSAYGLQDEGQVSGAPDWAKSEWFDVQVKIGAADLAEMQKLSKAESGARWARMMQTLLAERFQLKAHSETKQVPVYELVVAKGGPKLKDAATDTDPNLKKGDDGKPLAGIFLPLQFTSVVQGYTMGALADYLSAPFTGVGRHVLNKTGLTGTYDFTLNWSVYSGGVPVQNGEAAGSPADDAASIFDALQGVGLKLQPATGPVESIVIEHVERPSEN
jgi:uncharacterized protein (TIGR03435 family)